METREFQAKFKKEKKIIFPLFLHISALGSGVSLNE